MKIIRPQQLMDRVVRLYENGLEPGDKTGWPELDQYYSVAPGYLTILTGWPSSGKSEWLDALMMNLSTQGWKFVVYSPENMPFEMHLSKWLEKLWNKPFRRGPTERMTVDEAKEGVIELGQHFHFAGPNKDEASSVYSILECASMYFEDDLSDMKRGLVIDPWNEVEHGRPPNMNETEYVSISLGQIRTWARERKIHVWIVAHPKNVARIKDTGKLPIPTPDMISGSQHWWNKADCCVTVHRDLADLKNPDVDIFVQKMRFKHQGRPGQVRLRYSRLTGRYRTIASNFSVVRDDD